MRVVTLQLFDQLLPNTAAGVVRQVVGNIEWVALAALAVWYLRWYSLARRADADVDPFEIAAEGLQAEIRINARRVIGGVTVLFGGLIFASKVIGFSVPLLVTFDPVAWGSVAATVVGTLQTLGFDFSVEASLGAIIVVAAVIYVVRQLAQSALVSGGGS